MDTIYDSKAGCLRSGKVRILGYSVRKNVNFKKGRKSHEFGVPSQENSGFCHKANFDITPNLTTGA